MLGKMGKAVAVALIAMTILSGCDEVPGNPLTVEQKLADLSWIFTQFESNYAPMKYKSERWKLNFEALKAKARRGARASKSNQEFYAVMQEFIANFRDAHTSLTLTPSTLPYRSNIAFAGFLVERRGEDFVVREILPFVDAETLPVKVGDKILQVDGVPVKRYIDRFISKYRNLGNPESNYSLLANMVFFRDGLKMPLPERPFVTLKVIPAIPSGQYAATLQDVVIPWGIRDYSEFKAEMVSAGGAAAKGAKGGKRRPKQLLEITDHLTGKTHHMAVLGANGGVISAERAFPALAGKIGLADGFYFADSANVTFDSKVIERKLGSTPLERLRSERRIPKFANFVDGAHFLPAYTFPSDVVKDGKVTGKVLRGYLRIEDFDPQPIVVDGETIFPDTQAIRNELRHTLATFQQYGVTEIFIDTIDNPGGSLELLLEVAQAFSNKPIDLLSMKTRLNENWVSQMTKSALGAKFPEKEVFQRVLASMLQSMQAGETMSEALPMNVIVPFQVLPNTDLKRAFPKVFVMVSEGNASCGDIFPAIMADNGLAVVVGTRTMGAGGNVVSYDQAPNSHATLRQTESLAIRRDGTYLENNGVKPNIEIDYTLNRKGALDDTIAAVERVVPPRSGATTRTQYEVEKPPVETKPRKNLSRGECTGLWRH